MTENKAITSPGAMITPTLSAAALQTLQILADNPNGVSIARIALLRGVSASSAHRNVLRLCWRGRATTSKPGRDLVVFITEKGDRVLQGLKHRKP